MDYGLPSSIRETYDDFAHKLFRAPELFGRLDGQVPVTREGDVYALAMTFYEVDSVYSLMMDRH